MKRILLFGLVMVVGAAHAQISLVKDINSGASAVGSNPNNLTVLGSYVYYAASDGVTGTELWRSDGTLAGTTQVKDINPGDNSSSPSRFIVVGSYLYFRADDGVNGSELWRTDGTTNGTVMVADINPGNGSSSPDQMTLVNSTTLYFSAIDGTNGRELWKTDVGTLATSMIRISIRQPIPEAHQTLLFLFQVPRSIFRPMKEVVVRVASCGNRTVRH